MKVKRVEYQPTGTMPDFEIDDLYDPYDSHLEEMINADPDDDICKECDGEGVSNGHLCKPCQGTGRV